MEGNGGTETARRDSSRRGLFMALFAAAAAGTAAFLARAFVPFLAAPLKRSRGPAPADLGPAQALADAVASGTPREVVLSRRVRDGYMERRASERVAVVPDTASPAKIAVLSVTCTHLGCGVSWSSARGAFLCPCHGGVYARDGRVLAGPPPRPLARIPFTVEGGRVRLDLSALEEA